MSNATITVLVLSIPLLILSALAVGPLERRKIYLISAIIVSLVSGALILAGLSAAGMAAGHGSGDSGGWDDMKPMITWALVTIPLLFFGYGVRPRGKSDRS